MVTGRAMELQRLAALLDEGDGGGSGRGGGVAVLIVGEAGVGKTWLVRRLLAGASGATLVVRGAESSAEVAFADLARLLEPALPLLDRLDRPVRLALQVALGVGEDHPVEPLGVAVATLELLRSVAEEAGSLLVVVDDAQWIDDASLTTLRFCARRLDPSVGLLFVARSSHRDRLTGAGLIELELGGLTDDDARRLVRDHARGPVVDEVVERLVQGAGGNALALVECARELTLPQREGRGADPVQVTAPAALHETYAARLHQLKDDTRQALAVLAADETAGPAVIAVALARLDVDLVALEPAEAAGLVVLRPDGAVEFHHPLARDAVYHAVGADLRDAAHRALEVAWPPENVERRTWHRAHPDRRLDGGAAPNDDQLADSLTSVGHRARRRGAALAAAEAFARAAEYRSDRGERDALLLEAAGQFVQASRLEQALSAIDAVERTADVSDPRIAADIAMLRAKVLQFQGDLGGARRIFAETARLSAETDPGRAAAQLVEITVIHVMSGDAIAALPFAREAVRLAAASGSADVIARAEVIEASLDLLVGEAGTKRRSHARLAAHRARLCGDLYDGGWVPAVGATGLLWVDDLPATYALVDALVARAEEELSIRILPHLLCIRSQALVRNGALRRGYEVALEAHELAGSLSHHAGFEAVTVAGAACHLGLRDEVGARARAGLAIAQRTGAHAVSMFALAALGAEALGRGEPAEALVHLDQLAAGWWTVPSHEPDSLRWQGDHVEALVEVGRTGEAKAVLTLLTDDAIRTQGRWAAAAAARGAAMLAPSEAVDELFALSLSRESGPSSSPLERARTELRWAERLAGRGRRPEARRRLDSARRLFDGVEAAGWARRAAETGV